MSYVCLIFLHTGRATEAASLVVLGYLGEGVLVCLADFDGALERIHSWMSPFKGSGVPTSKSRILKALTSMGMRRKAVNSFRRLAFCSSQSSSKPSGFSSTSNSVQQFRA